MRLCLDTTHTSWPVCCGFHIAAQEYIYILNTYTYQIHISEYHEYFFVCLLRFSALPCKWYGVIIVYMYISNIQSSLDTMKSCYHPYFVFDIQSSLVIYNQVSIPPILRHLFAAVSTFQFNAYIYIY
jgi:hypothetical protein